MTHDLKMADMHYDCERGVTNTVGGMDMILEWLKDALEKCDGRQRCDAQLGTSEDPKNGLVEIQRF